MQIHVEKKDDKEDEEDKEIELKPMAKKRFKPT